jgi:hypothetical protein
VVAFQAISLYQLDPECCWRRVYFAHGMAELGGYGLVALGENEVEGRRRPGGVKRPAKFAFNLLQAQRMVAHASASQRTERLVRLFTLVPAGVWFGPSTSILPPIPDSDNVPKSRPGSARSSRSPRAHERYRGYREGSNIHAVLRSRVRYE